MRLRSTSTTVRLPGAPATARTASALAAAAVTLALAAPAPASADTPSRVSLMGTLQDEIGCAAEWDERCTANDLLRVAGSPTRFEKVVDLPAGA